MRGLWQRAGSVGLVVSVIFTQAASINLDDNEEDVHWVEKSFNVFQHVKRKEVCQPSGWSLCPSSVGGGVRAARLVGPVTTTKAVILRLGFLFPIRAQQAFSAVRFLSEVVVVGMAWRHTTVTVVTSTTTYIDAPNTSSGSPTVAEVPQLVPSTVAKISAVQTSDSNGGHGGLSSGALGGIVTGVIVIFVAVIVAATFIVLRLKKTERAAKDAEKAAESRRGSSNSPPRSNKSGIGPTTISEIDSTTDIDPYYRFPTMRPSHGRSRSATSVTADSLLSNTPNFIHSDTSSPPLWAMPFNYAPSEASDDNAPVRMSQRMSIDSQGTSRHGRHHSDTSELEEQHGRSELEADMLQRSDSATRPKMHVRRNSDLTGQNRIRGDSVGGALDTVNEIQELHGHYGPHTTAGQTTAASDRGHSSGGSASGYKDT
ncbi:hypothetical protein GQX73_g9729 [Xylaria multiplex]|uniref:Mid2 domain-containing protein n=1 Tax=Xylaria multiplex TaxID=323545 RepID=A0A7C8MND3_9PEZI|nr:hypothetical protein GQX73_g9729 [Xylaria multiplex]